MPIKAIVFDAYGTLYDVHSVAGVVTEAFPEHGEYITQVWRMKQLEYSWLRALMGQYADFRTVTCDALCYTLGTLGLRAETAVFDRIVNAQNTLTPYPEADAALGQLKPYQLAILSNGTQDMLDALVRSTGFGGHFDAVISVDDRRTFKPDPKAYSLVETRLGVRPDEVVFVSSSGFDVAGAKSFGFKVARIERLTPDALRQDLSVEAHVGPTAMYKALRTQTEALGFAPDAVVDSLLELPALVPTLHS